jgi:two-component system NtrC family sensor kinase
MEPASGADGGEPTPGAGAVPSVPAAPPHPDSSPGPLESIPWKDRLSTQLMGVAVAMLVGAVAVFAVMEVVIGRQRIANISGSTSLLSETIVASINQAMMGDKRDEAYAIIDNIGRQPLIDHVRLFNKEGRITFSTVPGEKGNLVDKRAEGCRACHGPDETLLVPVDALRSRLYEGKGHRVLAVITPMRSTPTCSTSGCHAHPREQQVLGVLDVGVSLATVDHDLSDFRRSTLLVTAVAILLLAAFFWWFTKRRIVKPVEALVQATRRVAHDELDTEIQVDSRGELGLLAASFNDMIRSLRKVEGELRQLTLNLEAKVEERTAELRAAQDSLVRSEKLSSLGKLSASIAH